jgi:hypothetical protein
MNIDAEPDYVIDHGIENPPGPALLVRQAGKLAIGVIKNVRDHMQRQSGEIDDECAIEIKMAGNDPEYSADDRDGRWRELQSRKKSGEMKTDSSIKDKIDNSFKLARFVGRVDRRSRF